jgi:hypothetical protein
MSRINTNSIILHTKNKSISFLFSGDVYSRCLFASILDSIAFQMENSPQTKTFKHPYGLLSAGGVTTGGVTTGGVIIGSFMTGSVMIGWVLLVGVLLVGVLLVGV